MSAGPKEHALLCASLLFIVGVIAFAFWLLGYMLNKPI